MAYRALTKLAVQGDKMAKSRSSLSKGAQPAAIDIVSRMQRVESGLSPAERAVATRTYLGELAPEGGARVMLN